MVLSWLTKKHVGELISPKNWNMSLSITICGNSNFFKKVVGAYTQKQWSTWCDSWQKKYMSCTIWLCHAMCHMLCQGNLLLGAIDSHSFRIYRMFFHRNGSTSAREVQQNVSISTSSNVEIPPQWSQMVTPCWPSITICKISLCTINSSYSCARATHWKSVMLNWDVNLQLVSGENIRDFLSQLYMYIIYVCGRSSRLCVLDYIELYTH